MISLRLGRRTRTGARPGRPYQGTAASSGMWLANGEPEANLDEHPAGPLPDRRSWFAGLGAYLTAAHRRYLHLYGALAG